MGHEGARTTAPRTTLTTPASRRADSSTHMSVVSDIVTADVSVPEVMPTEPSKRDELRCVAPWDRLTRHVQQWTPLDHSNRCAGSGTPRASHATLPRWPVMCRLWRVSAGPSPYAGAGQRQDVSGNVEDFGCGVELPVLGVLSEPGPVRRLSPRRSMSAATRGNVDRGSATTELVSPITVAPLLEVEDRGDDREHAGVVMVSATSPAPPRSALPFDLGERDRFRRAGVELAEPACGREHVVVGELGVGDSGGGVDHGWPFRQGRMSRAVADDGAGLSPFAQSTCDRLAQRRASRRARSEGPKRITAARDARHLKGRRTALTRQASEHPHLPRKARRLAGPRGTAPRPSRCRARPFVGVALTVGEEHEVARPGRLDRAVHRGSTSRRGSADRVVALGPRSVTVQLVDPGPRVARARPGSATSQQARPCVEPAPSATVASALDTVPARHRSRMP